jgi:hypothetical protein
MEIKQIESEIEKLMAEWEACYKELQETSAGK